MTLIHKETEVSQHNRTTFISRAHFIPAEIQFAASEIKIKMKPVYAAYTFTHSMQSMHVSV